MCIRDRNRIIKAKDIEFDLDKMVVYKQKEEIRVNKLGIKNIAFVIYQFKQSCYSKRHYR